MSQSDGKSVDSYCHKLTATHVRIQHKKDPDNPACSFYEVVISLCTTCNQLIVNATQIYKTMSFQCLLSLNKQ